MSKSLKRVILDAETRGLRIDVQELDVSTKTAREAADAANCHIDQIVKSIVLKGETSGRAILFLTAGGRRICLDKASALAGEKLGKADAALIREQTGFAIGGVSPLGHTNPIRVFMDSTLLGYTSIWAAAGTPRHIFSIDTQDLRTAVGAEVSDFTE